MKLCPRCESDLLERTSSTILRVLACIILLFIPYGFLICWIPFIFPHKYRCRVCNKECKEKELVEMDWRVKETMKNDWKQEE